MSRSYPRRVPTHGCRRRPSATRLPITFVRVEPPRPMARRETPIRPMILRLVAGLLAVYSAWAVLLFTVALILLRSGLLVLTVRL